jgi:LmbE family N-acetylglucosaminyl deacetylase
VRLPPALLRRVVALRPDVSTSVLRAAVDLVSLAPTGLPVTVLPAVRRVLVLAPHPDDESIGCGGTIARFAAAGATVSVLGVTDGEATIGAAGPVRTTAARRRAELEAACAILGAEPPSALGLPDGAVSRHEPELVQALGETLRAGRPQLVLTPWPLERHPDHRATTAALAAALGREHAAAPSWPHPEVWGYEAHTAITAPTRVVDITLHLDRKRAALAAHATAAQAFELEACLGLARWRSLATTAGRGAAEAFVALDRDDLSRAVTAGARGWRR